MGVLTNETTTLKLYNSLDDEVWYISGNGTPRPSNILYDEYCDNPSFLNKKLTVRLVGDARNAKLVSAMYEAKVRGDIKDVQVCSPQVEWINLDEYCPEKVLLNMRRWKYPSTLGGFHSVTKDEHIVYTLSHMMAGEGAVASNLDMFMALYEEHPLFNYMNFIPGVNQHACMLIVASTLDPRWFTDLFFPNKLSKYYDYMGVNKLKQNLTENSDTRGGAITKAQRRGFVISAWQAYKNWDKMLITTESGKSDFLLGTYFNVATSFVGNKPIESKEYFDEAILATCQKFLAYLHGCWLNLLYPMPNAWNEPLFVPEHFFPATEEVQRFRETFCKKT
jgi:hypothetical protein